ncbi:alpha-D-ribose 1-methylphosphonate 5-triphosphate synthase subunit PhnG [Gracilibacillus halotolerans]|uniref:Alpha-D-ribose 1-methylphosphonate 5-triphosphate synthase subunit PhnG n=1 Tax=Gracilibacillus halotolerans TaxID=74386 RepID=A0A841RQZ8_9BACI|nr:phosphonate C-P lyase system protein PhnG [Gracilibacillus halotolerans]MBB6514043.1 alpha-D-ribose 1-methylphosphonate 5-triphosphate synthase subunit PhnG [Gracilibacillus halotolerans]
MNRRRRTEILIQGKPSLAQKLADEIKEKYLCQEVSAPKYGLTMMKVRETAKNSLFYIGEVLVTEAKVAIKQEIGVGIVIGMKDELATHLAIIDAAYNAELPETANWEAPLLAEEQAIREEKIHKQAQILRTKVQFETMEV